MRHLLSVPVRRDQDVVVARQRAGQVAQLLGFDPSEQTRIATAASEIVRNAFRYAGGGEVLFGIVADARPQRLVIQISDAGPGIPHLDDVLAGRYRSATGMGMGIVGARRLMDRFAIESRASGTAVVLEKFLSPRQDVLTEVKAQQIVAALAKRRPEGLLEEIEQQNQALLRTLDELQRKQQELLHLNRELEDTNRGVVALYAELDEKADHLRRADQLKSRFLSNMSHEFRTPVNSIIGLSNLLLDDRHRGGIEPEPEVLYIRKAAEQLSELVNDLLDLAKVEAGKTIIRPSEFSIANLFGALRGMLRPLLLTQSVALIFDIPETVPGIYTDEGKLSQILRNLISNALKFTERGEVRVAASGPDENGIIRFTVSDTGIGIAPEDLTRIFDEFAQVEHRLQQKVKGTGLGLSLSRRLTELLGGTLTVESEPGVGSTFTIAIPARYRVPRPEALETVDWVPDPDRVPLLIVEDEPDAQYFYEKILRSSAYQVYPAYTVHEAGIALEQVQPSAIVLDVRLGDDETWEFLTRLRRNPQTAATPVVVISTVNDRDRALALGADSWLMKPVDRRKLLDALMTLHRRHNRSTRVMVVDDDEAARYLIGQCLPLPLFEVIEVPRGQEGLARAHDSRPDVILLDLLMPEIGGREILQQLRADPVTRDTPVLIVTSQALAEPDRAALLRDAQNVMSKADLSRETLGRAVREALAPAPPL